MFPVQINSLDFLLCITVFYDHFPHQSIFSSAMCGVIIKKKKISFPQTPKATNDLSLISEGKNKTKSKQKHQTELTHQQKTTEDNRRQQLNRLRRTKWQNRKFGRGSCVYTQREDTGAAHQVVTVEGKPRAQVEEVRLIVLAEGQTPRAGGGGWTDWTDVQLLSLQTGYNTSLKELKKRDKKNNKVF